MSSRKLIVGAAAAAMTFAVAGFASAQAAGTQKTPSEQHEAQSQKQKMPSQQSHQKSKAQMQEQRGSTAVRLHRSQVKEVQSALKKKGLYEGGIDGLMGPKTQAALEAFQRQQSLTVSGAPDRETLSALGLSPERQPVRGEETAKGLSEPQRTYQVGREAETHYQISAMGQAQAKMLQQKLHELGVYDGPIDGVAGPRTQAAVREYFQKQTELARKGWISESGLKAFEMKPPSRQTQQTGQTRQTGQPSNKTGSQSQKNPSGPMR